LLQDKRMDLIIRNVHRVAAPDEGPVDIAVADEKIAAIGPNLTAECESYDAGGRLACAGLIETHIHLDKSRIIDR
jgi:cytosine/creatinine deaminase